MITSVTNQKVKDVVKLREFASRRKHHLFIIEGLREFFLALEEGVVIKQLYICKELFSGINEENIVRDALRQKINVREVARKVYEKMAYGSRREGIIAVAQQPEYQLSDIELSINPFIVVVEQVEKPGNLGAILRTSDAAGVDGIIVVDAVTDVYNHNVVRTSVGTVFTLPVVLTSSQEAFKWLEKLGIAIICAHPTGKPPYTSIDFRKPTALVVGSEEKGVSSFWKENSDVLASIPMIGKADSLNVSTTAAIFIFEALRQRGQ